MQRKHQMIPNTEVEIIQKDWRTAKMISQNMTKYNLTVCFGIFLGKFYTNAAEKHTYDPAALFKNSMPESLNEKRLLDQAAKESIWLLFRRWA